MLFLLYESRIKKAQFYFFAEDYVAIPALRITSQKKRGITLPREDYVAIPTRIQNPDAPTEKGEK